MAGNMNDPQTTQSLSQQLMHSDLFTYIGVVAFSCWGGVTRFLQSKDKFSWHNLVAQLTSSSFAGMMAYMACQYTHVSGPLAGGLTGVASYMGTPALIALAMRLKIVKDALTPAEKETTEGRTE